MRRKIFISSPRSIYLDAAARNFKDLVIGEVRKAGFDPQFYDPQTEFGGGGKAEGRSWSSKEAEEIMADCSGAVLIGFAYWNGCTKTGDPAQQTHALITEYCHYEGALARACKIPLFLLLQDGVTERIMYLPHGGEEIVRFDASAGTDWIASASFQRPFNSWRNKVRSRFDLFFGYSSAAESTAKEIRLFLEQSFEDLKILDWNQHFNQGSTIIAEIERAAQVCNGAMFLFTKDDLLVPGEPGTNTTPAMPRANVVFEAGYFAHSKGIQRVLIIAEADARIPSDLGGVILSPALINRADINPLKERLRHFVLNNF